MIRMLMQEETLEILGLEQAVIYVSNMNRALDFYSRLLGIQVKVRSEEWSELVLNGIVVGLHQSKATPEERGNLTRAEGVKLGFSVRNIKQTVEILRRRGIEVRGPQELPEGGWIANLADTEGNPINVIEGSK